ncbi:hypothetical protein [Thermogemmatispora sp.]|uniref:hypothetical protein n=1 Tax=Thermogemmatispora sp. TaxID=1968838 RepID=UPI0035E43DF5
MAISPLVSNLALLLFTYLGAVPAEFWLNRAEADRHRLPLSSGVWFTPQRECRPP